MLYSELQENKRSISDDCITSEHDFRTASSSTGGLALGNSIATLVEHQRADVKDCSTSYDNNKLSSLSTLHSQRTNTQRQQLDLNNEFRSSTRTATDSRLSFGYLTEQGSEDGYRSIISSGQMLPESFEEQMKLAMTLSLAEPHTALHVRKGLASRH